MKATDVLIRVGIPNPNGGYVHAAIEKNYPVMMSASAFWLRKKNRFMKPGKQLEKLDIFLDSAGFTAMSHYGGYPWSVDQYLQLVKNGKWTHWSAMDLCCEPEISTDRSEIARRIQKTVEYLQQCKNRASYYEISQPVPIIQGFLPFEYTNCAELMDTALNGIWPNLIGIGSVCRRSIGGVVSIVDHLDRVLPKHVKFHLFGVKSGALARLCDHHRVLSTDSMAWNFKARVRCREAKISCSVKECIVDMHKWYNQQRRLIDIKPPIVQMEMFNNWP